MTPTPPAGHAKRNAPGAVDHLFYGFYGQVATMVRDEGGRPDPELVRRSAFDAPSTDPAALMAETLSHAYDEGVPPGDVLSDCGYSNPRPTELRPPTSATRRRARHGPAPKRPWAKGHLRRRRHRERQPLLPFHADGALRARAQFGKGAGQAETAAHDVERPESSPRYKLGRVSRDDEDGAHRVTCPAEMGKIRCPLRAESMTLDFSHPERSWSESTPPTCCAQRTITVPEKVLAKTAQKHDYPSAAHRRSYNRRTGSERTFAWLQDPGDDRDAARLVPAHGPCPFRRTPSCTAWASL